MPPRAASSLFAYSNPQPFEQIIKIHLYLICLLELIEFLRLANVSGCTLPPNGDPAAGAAGTAHGSHHPPGKNPTLEQGTGRPLAPLGCQDAGMLSDTRRASLQREAPQTPRDSNRGGFGGDTGTPSLPFPHPCWRCQHPAGIVVTLRAMRAFLPSPSSSSSSSSQIAKASNLPAGKAEGKEPLFCR